jgi:hypothetical protein
LAVKGWTSSELIEHLRLCDWLIAAGSTTAAPAGVDWPLALDSYLFEQPDLGSVHRRVLEEPPLRPSTLQIRGAVPTAMGMLPAYAAVPAAAKLAWRLAWVDRLAAWEGRDVVFSSAARAGFLLPFLQALRVARTATTDWAKLFTSCLAVAEYPLAILRRRGLGPAFGFLPAQ